ncbi:MAG: class II aldolase/adducin family protein [Haloferacaceae archaeon]
MDARFDDARRDVRAYGRRLVDEGLTTGTGGNLSARVDDHVAVSPSGVPYEEISPQDVPVLSLAGERVGEGREPSVELDLHLAAYRARDDVGGVVHTHSPYATTYAALGEPIPAVHYLVAAAGGPVPVAPYARFGTEELADVAVETLGTERDACLLANHGVVAVGDSLPDAFETAVAVEYAARIAYQAAAIGDPVELDADRISDLRDALDDYGRD